MRCTVCGQAPVALLVPLARPRSRPGRMLWRRVVRGRRTPLVAVGLCACQAPDLRLMVEVRWRWGVEAQCTVHMPRQEG